MRKARSETVGVVDGMMRTDPFRRAQ